MCSSWYYDWLSNHSSKEDFETLIVLPIRTILKLPELQSSYAFFRLTPRISITSITVYVLFAAVGLMELSVRPIAITSFRTIGPTEEPIACNSIFIIKQRGVSIQSDFINFRNRKAYPHAGPFPAPFFSRVFAGCRCAAFHLRARSSKRRPGTLSADPV